MRSTMISVLTAWMVAVVAACTGSTSPSDPPLPGGTYVLATINGAPPPFTTTIGSTTFTVVTDTIVLNAADGTYRSHGLIYAVGTGASTVDTTPASGQYWTYTVYAPGGSEHTTDCCRFQPSGSGAWSVYNRDGGQGGGNWLASDSLAFESDITQVSSTALDTLVAFTGVISLSTDTFYSQTGLLGADNLFYQQHLGGFQQVVYRRQD